MQAGRHITSKAPSLGEYLNEVGDYKQLLRFFIWRDIVVRYKEAALGIAWVVIKPLLTMLLFTFVFGLVARFPSDNVNYALFVLAAMIPWQYFANCTNDSCSSLINNSQLITKAYFPRLVLPLSQITAQLIDLGINTLIFLLLTPFLGSFPSFAQLALIPFLSLWTYLFCVATGLWLAPLTARFRDVRFLVSFILQFGMFLSPVGYGTFLIPEKWSWIYALNPLVGIIDAYRYVLLNLTHPLIGWTVSYSIAATLILLFSGISYFRKTEEDLVDIL